MLAADRQQTGSKLALGWWSGLAAAGSTLGMPGRCICLPARPPGHRGWRRESVGSQKQSAGSCLPPCLQWLAWTVVMGQAWMFVKLASLRGDALLSSPRATPGQHLRILALLGGILAQVGGSARSPV